MTFERVVSIRDVITYSDTGGDAIKTVPIVDYDTGIRCARVGDLSNNRNFNEWGFCQVIEQEYKKYKLYRGDILVSRTASLGLTYLVKEDIPGVYNNGLIRIRPNQNLIDPEYLYYKLRSQEFINYINQINGDSSTRPNMKIKYLLDYEFSLPDYPTQLLIANLISSFDDKIELNNRMNKVLEQMSQAIFKQWFVDFEFPNENGEPYKSSGGEMEWCEELGKEIPKGWRVGTLGEVIVNFDSKRIPLSKNEREKRKKIYPYYGAASIADYVDDYLFDGIYVLLGEDGTVIDNEGYPILQYVWGKFWVNNHAHVLRGREGYSNEFIYLLLKGTSVQGAVTGAVQPKISQGNLNSIQITIPDISVVRNFSNLIDGFFEKYRVATDKNKILSSIRDTLLPKLMSGEIDVSEMEL